MKGFLRMDYEKERIMMSRDFAKAAQSPDTAEYRELQKVKENFPNYTLEVRSIKTNSEKESYKGLTYSYMENYILSHGDNAEVQEALSEYRKLREIAKCHNRGKGYPVIKHWFLECYPEVKNFGVAA